MVVSASWDDGPPSGGQQSWDDDPDDRSWTENPDDDFWNDRPWDGGSSRTAAAPTGQHQSLSDQPRRADRWSGAGESILESGSTSDRDDRDPVPWEQPSHRRRRQAERQRGQDGSGGQRSSRADRRNAKFRRRAQEREARWEQNRLAVPYRIDGPKISFGVIWFAAAVGAILSSTVLLAVLVAAVAGLAGLQAGHAWFGDESQAKWWTAFAAFVPGVLGVIGPVGLGAGIGIALLVLAAGTMLEPDDRLPLGIAFGAQARSSIPIGLAAGSLVALSEFELGAVLSLVLLVSAYESGDFLVGSGSSNALEGPISGMVALSSVLFVLWVVAPTPFTDRSMVLFGILAAVCCPLGQILASALLPRGAAWAPALRRLDSYLVVAPLWLFLLHTAPDTTSL